MDRIKLGKITAPHGVRGEVRVYSYADELTRFSNIQELFIEDKPAKVESARPHKGMIIMKLDCVPDRNTAELMRNKTLYVDRKSMENLPENVFVVQDLVGCSCVDENGSSLGTLTEVILGSAQDIYVVKDSAGRENMIPAVKEFIKSVDVNNKVIVIHVIEGLFSE